MATNRSSTGQREITKTERAGGLLTLVALLGFPALIGFVVYMNRKKEG